MKLLSSLHQLSDRFLLDQTARLAACECSATAELIAAIAEVDARRLYLGESCSSMFTYCTRVLHLSEHAAYDRIEAARLARRFPEVLEQLASGSLTLTNLRLLAPHLTAGNVEALTKETAHKSKHEVEQVIARLRPQPPVPSAIRKLPVRSPSPPLVSDEGDCAELQTAPVLAGARPSTVEAGHRSTARAGALLQGPVHRFQRDAREAPPRPGPDASHHPERRCGVDLRPRAFTAARRSREEEGRGDRAPTRHTTWTPGITAHSGERQAAGVEAR